MVRCYAGSEDVMAVYDRKHRKLSAEFNETFGIENVEATPYGVWFENRRTRDGGYRQHPRLRFVTRTTLEELLRLVESCHEALVEDRD